MDTLIDPESPFPVVNRIRMDFMDRCASPPHRSLPNAVFRLLSLRLHGPWPPFYKSQVATPSSEEVKPDTAQMILQGYEGFIVMNIVRLLAIITLSL